jgi:hypothetical protein
MIRRDRTPSGALVIRIWRDPSGVKARLIATSTTEAEPTEHWVKSTADVIGLVEQWLNRFEPSTGHHDL